MRPPTRPAAVVFRRVPSGGHGGDFYMVALPGGRELGSWVPDTGSARVGPVMHAGVATIGQARALFMRYAQSLARAGGKEGT